MCACTIKHILYFVPCKDLQHVFFAGCLCRLHSHVFCLAACTTDGFLHSREFAHTTKWWQLIFFFMH